LRRPNPVSSALCGFLLAAGIATAAQSSNLPEKTVVAAETNVFAQLREQWAHNLRDKKIEACVAAYAPDGEFIQPDGSRVRGTDALHKLYATITSTFDSDLVFDSQRVAVSSELAYDSGTFREILILRATGKPLFSTGSYLTVYRHEKNGQWLIVEQMWTGPNPDSMVKLDLDPQPFEQLASLRP
jgi:ketosteroid isomerase-like protein